MSRSSDALTYANVAIVRATDEHLLAALAHVHAVNDFFVSWVPPDPFASLNVPTREVHVCRRREQYFRVPRPVEV
jgi:hypothetical protein